MQSHKCDDGGLVLHISGDGKLCIRNAKTNSKQFDNTLLDIVINKNSLDMPMSVVLSAEQAGSELEITKGKNVKIVVNGTMIENKSMLARDVRRMKDVDVIDTTCGEIKNSNKHKTHKRNNSDFLHVVGKDDLNIVDSMEDIENVTTNSDEPFPLVKDKQKHDCVINGNSKSENLPHQSPEVSSLPRQFSFSKTLQFNGNNRLSLKEAIRKSYTYLLDVLDVLEFCDNLYQNYVIDISFYQKLFEMCFDPRHVRSAKRKLLMYLSTKTVEKDNLIDALFGSAQYQLVPFFYPDVKM